MLNSNSQEQPIRNNPHGPSQFRWLPSGPEGLEAMLQAIDGASKVIQFEMYIFTPGPLGERFRDALVQARLRGVRVQVLIDAFGSIGLPISFWHPLIQLGGEFRWFNSFHAAERYGRRNHRKLLVADNQRAIVGGFNVDEVYKGDGVSAGWSDLGLEIQGPLALALAESFTTLFKNADSPPPVFPTFRKSPATTARGDNWTLLLTEPGRGNRAFKQSLIRDLSRSHSVRIICAYFVPTWRLRRALMRTARRGGRVQLILAGRTDVEVSRLASRSLYSKLMRAGVEIYEYQPQILHTKLLIVDHVVYAGSSNLDIRSLNINQELMIRITDEEMVVQAQAIFDRDLLHSRKVNPTTWRASRSIFMRFLERVAHFLISRIDPHITSLRWRNRAREALEKRGRREAMKK